MSEHPETSVKPATAKEWGLDLHPIGSMESRARARAFLEAREETSWDAPIAVPTNIAAAIEEARRRCAPMKDAAWERGEWYEHPAVFHPIPPGKENTVRGKLYDRMNKGNARVRAMYEGQPRCSTCNALIRDAALHENWHRTQKAAIQ